MGNSNEIEQVKFSIYGNNNTFGGLDKMEAYIIHIRDLENAIESKNKVILKNHDIFLKCH